MLIHFYDYIYQMIHEKISQAYETGNINELRRLQEKTGLPGKDVLIDKAVETGNFEMAKFLASECDICPSLYLVQKALISGHTKTLNVTLAKCPNLRDKRDIQSAPSKYMCL